MDEQPKAVCYCCEKETQGLTPRNEAWICPACIAVVDDEAWICPACIAVVDDPVWKRLARIGARELAKGMHGKKKKK